MIDSNDWNP